MICVSIADVTIDEALDIIKTADISEIRLDRLDFKDEDLAGLFLKEYKTLATYRPVEGITDERRMTVLKSAIDSGASMVDVEVENSDIFKEELVSYAKDRGCEIIISYHNYEKTPFRRELEQVIAWCFESGADIAKVACMANSVHDSARILSLYDQDKRVIAIAMGEAGRITRVAAPILGSPFTFGSIDKSKETAPGQFAREELEQIIELIKK